VVTPAAWRVNFTDGLDAIVHHLGRARKMTGTLITDPVEVAATLRALLASGTRPAHIGLHVPPDHAITRADVLAVDRALIRFAPIGGATTPMHERRRSRNGRPRRRESDRHEQSHADCLPASRLT
jgi:hypothetical protein